jgi:hypothetical protein
MFPSIVFGGSALDTIEAGRRVVKQSGFFLAAAAIRLNAFHGAG